jgi:septum formation inhibitor-activating ATPase MinD
MGKTSVSGAVAAGLARRGKKNVFVDADPPGQRLKLVLRRNCQG